MDVAKLRVLSFAYRWMVMERVRAKISTIHWALVVRFFLTGLELRELGESNMERKAEMRPALTKSLVREDSGTSEHGS